MELKESDKVIAGMIGQLLPVRVIVSDCIPEDTIICNSKVIERIKDKMAEIKYG